MPAFANDKTTSKRRITLLIVVVIGLACAVQGVKNYQSEHRSYITAPVTKGNIIQSVTATGNLRPVNTVTVGTQVTGPVTKVFVDTNDIVKKGQLLAEIDPSLQLAQIQQTQAQMDNAKSSLHLAGLNVARLKRLYDAGYIALADWERADQEASSARSSYEVSKAQLDRDRKNLEYAEVHSPVDGVVIMRSVNVGQTVQGSYQTAELFLIADDMKQMQIDISIAEADVGRVKEGQKVRFTVDAYPDRNFEGAVTRLKLNPNNQQGVVTYSAIVNVENPEKLLLPGMTAYVSVIINEKPDVLLIPASATRFVPTRVKSSWITSLLTTPSAPDAVSAEQDSPSVYVLKNGRPEKTFVTTGINDDNNIEILNGALPVNTPVIVREQQLHDDGDSAL